MVKDNFVIKGDIVWSKTPQELQAVKDGFVVVVDGKSAGVFAELPEQYKNLEVLDYTGKLVIPGLVDAHIHAPQYAFRGTGMDLELLDWLDTYTFPEESKYVDLDYADKAYTIFADDLKNSATTRAVVFATRFVPSTVMLMDKLEESGVNTMVGKVNQDRNSNPKLQEASYEESLKDTVDWLDQVAAKNYKNTQPILTPRFTPTCTDELMEGLGKIKQERGLNLQSHLSENLSEIDWVKELCPWSTCYGDTYLHFGQLGKPGKAIMAHCVWSTPEEVEILKDTETYIAHCPQSNADLSSGIAPIRKYMDLGMHVGLGSDIAGGANLSMFRAIADAIAVSKLRWRCVDESLKPLTVAEAFFLATMGGGEFFGKVGSFDEGFEFDALVLDDSGLKTPREWDTVQRVERYCYLAEEGGKIEAKFVNGAQII
jgi:guanine deaminase